LGDFCVKIKPGDKIDVVFEMIANDWNGTRELQVFEMIANDWNGTRELQLKIIDLKKS